MCTHGRRLTTKDRGKSDEEWLDGETKSRNGVHSYVPRFFLREAACILPCVLCLIPTKADGKPPPTGLAGLKYYMYHLTPPDSGCASEAKPPVRCAQLAVPDDSLSVHISWNATVMAPNCPQHPKNNPICGSSITNMCAVGVDSQRSQIHAALGDAISVSYTHLTLPTKRIV